MWRDASEVGVEESRAAWAEAARPILIEVAQHYHAVITYKDLAEEAQRVTGIRGTQQMHYWIGDVLGRVSRDAFSRGSRCCRRCASRPTAPSASGTPSPSPRPPAT